MALLDIANDGLKYLENRKEKRNSKTNSLRLDTASLSEIFDSTLSLQKQPQSCPCSSSKGGKVGFLSESKITCCNDEPGFEFSSGNQSELFESPSLRATEYSQSRGLNSKGKNTSLRLSSSRSFVSSYNEVEMRSKLTGFYRPFVLLQLLSETDRCHIRNLLNIERKRTKPYCSIENEVEKILFSRPFGIQCRTDSFLRKCRILGGSTWCHTLYRAGTSLTASFEMLVTTGDWRLPSRITSKLSRKQAIVDTEMIEYYEDRFLNKLQVLVERRLAEETNEACKQYLESEKGKNLVARMNMAGNQGKHALLLLQIFELRRQHEESLRQAEEASFDEALAQACTYDAKDKPRRQIFRMKLRKCVSRNLSRIKTNPNEEPEATHNSPQLKRSNSMRGFSFTMRNKLSLQRQIEYEEQEAKRLDYCSSSLRGKIHKLAFVGVKDAIFGLSIGITLSALFHPAVGLPFGALSIINLTAGSTEISLLEPVAMILIQKLIFAANGNNVFENA